MLDGYQNSPKMINEFEQYFIVVRSVIFTYNTNIDGIIYIWELCAGGTGVLPEALDPLVSKTQ